MKNFDHMAKLIKNYRKSSARNYSQSELSRSLGYKQGQFVSNIERGLCSLPLNKANKIIEELGIPKDELKQAYIDDFNDFFEDSVREKVIDAGVVIPC